MKFDDIVGAEGLSGEDEARLRRVHDLLVQAGPPPDLPPALERPATPGEDVEPPEVPVLFRRRRGLAAVLALAAAIAVFAGGYGFGHSKAKRAAFETERAVPMSGAVNTAGVIRLGKADGVGNWPMLVEVTGLPEQADRKAYYELWLTKNDKPVAPCGSFRVHGKTTRVRFTVPYSLRGYDGWVVTAQPAHVHTPGRVVLTTT
jgi:hypothetical protein